MAETKTCPKCNGTMTQGRVMKYNEYAARNQYLYVFAPDDDSGPDLSKMFSGKPLSKSRKALIAFACDQCVLQNSMLNRLSEKSGIYGNTISQKA